LPTSRKTASDRPKSNNKGRKRLGYRRFFSKLLGGLQMNLVRTLSLVAAFSVVGVSSPPHSEEGQPQTAPTRDVDITYQITRPGRPALVERRRWLASQHLRRVDGPDKSATIFDQSRGELTVLNAANHTYLTLEGPAAKRMNR